MRHYFVCKRLGFLSSRHRYLSVIVILISEAQFDRQIRAHASTHTAKAHRQLFRIYVYSHFWFGKMLTCVWEERAAGREMLLQDCINRATQQKMYTRMVLHCESRSKIRINYIATGFPWEINFFFQLRNCIFLQKQHVILLIAYCGDFQML